MYYTPYLCAQDDAGQSADEDDDTDAKAVDERFNRYRGSRQRKERRGNIG